MGFAGLFQKNASQQGWLWNKSLKQTQCSHWLYSLILATEFVYGNSPNFWRRMITPEYVGNFSLSPVHKNPT